MYPLEWLAEEASNDEWFAQDLESLNLIEPAWKIIVGNKALLPLLWEMYPDH